MLGVRVWVRVRVQNMNTKGSNTNGTILNTYGSNTNGSNTNGPPPCQWSCLGGMFILNFC